MYKMVNETTQKQRLEILKKQQETTNQINALLEKSAEAIVCGPDCQKTKTKNELEQKYLNAQTNMQTAPIQLEDARKNYYVFAEGSGAYNNILEQDLQKKAEEIGKVISLKFKEEVLRAKTLNIYYNSDLINSKNTIELYENYLKKNKTTEKLIKSSYGDVLTNDRKSYYETQEYDGLKSWYTFFIIIYYILFIVFFLGTFFSPNNLSLKQKIGISIFLFSYPVIIGVVFELFFGLISKIKSYLPKNVYNNLQ